MRRSQPINLRVYMPTDAAGKQELAGRVAEIHAQFVAEYISHLDCPAEQKRLLIDTIIEDTKKRQIVNATSNIFGFSTSLCTRLIYTGHT